MIPVLLILRVSVLFGPSPRMGTGTGVFQNCSEVVYCSLDFSGLCIRTNKVTDSFSADTLVLSR